MSNETVNEKEEWKTTIELKIMQLEAADLDVYKCSAKSIIGEAEATLRLHRELSLCYLAIQFHGGLFGSFNSHECLEGRMEWNKKLEG